jgi:GNAT superfamily N-acetyltransferase
VIEIKKLTPDLIDIFTSFFEHIEYDHAPSWKSCYCHYYHSSCSFDEWKTRSSEQNKLASIQAIYDGMMTGFLAFQNHQCIGWANINHAGTYPRLVEELKPYIQQKNVALSICFVIHPDFRNQGVARVLLDHAIEYYRYKGYDGMLALPIEGDFKKELHYRGTMHMYEERGYEKIGENGNTKIFYKKL